jgi:hypothetical protein
MDEAGLETGNPNLYLSKQKLLTNGTGLFRLAAGDKGFSPEYETIDN